MALKKTKTCYQIFGISLVGAILVIVLTSNLSSAIIIVAIGAVMVVIAGACRQFIISLVGAGGIGIAAIIGISALAGKSFRLSRILVWLHPEEYSDSGGYQVLQGLYAIGSGGLFGKGLGNSAQKLGFVPEAANDMIFSIICEELGIFGALCIICLFLFMIRRMRVIASNAPDLYGSMLVVGVMAHISIQAVLNMAVVTNSIPNTGVSLPFISYGGTSLAFLMVEVGIVLSVSSRIKRIR
jgi:cell division protein FtsW